jgi:hypothetical protein
MNTWSERPVGGGISNYRTKKGGPPVRHILAGLALAPTVALSATAALAFGDKVEYPGPGLSQSVIAAIPPSHVNNSVARRAP